MLVSTRLWIVASLQVVLFWKLIKTSCYGAGSCTCESKPEGFIIHCRGKSLTAVPQFSIPPELSGIIFYELNLQGNVINTISDNAFLGIKFKRIVLSDNPINVVSNEAFVGLENCLEELLLSFEKDNVDVEIPVVALQNLTNLKLLEILAYAKPALPTNAFSALTNLEDLTLVDGNLATLSQDDLIHQSKLVNLSLEGNRFKIVPDIFKTAVGNLSNLRLDSNQINRISSGAFRGVGNLRVLDISQNAIQFVDNDAFVGLEGSLQSLNCRNCRLEDAHLPSFKPLRSLKELILPGNMLTGMDNLLRGMKSLQNLQILNVQGNKITSLSSSIFNDMTNSLKVLDLSDNPFTSISPNTFASLKQLRELQLNNIDGLQLDRNTFLSQRMTIKTLSLSGANFQLPQWAAIANLTALEVLVLSNCNISTIPDFAFVLNNKLSNLDLSDNEIPTLTQRNLAGLQTSLVQIILSHNRIRTLDECVFHEFTQMDFNRFGMNSNPLRCDCALRWLFDRLKPFVSQLSVKCEDGSDFLSSENVFANCPISAPSCESLLPSTIIPPNIQVTINDLSSTSMIVSWSIRVNIDVSNFYVAYRVSGVADFLTVPLNVSDRQFSLSGLIPGTAYEICVLVELSTNIDMRGCTNATTSESIVILSQQAIIGISVGAGCALIIVIIFVIVLCVRASRRTVQRVVIHQPHTGEQSKRFVKHVEPELLGSPTGTLDDNIVHTLARMPIDEKNKLLCFIRDSRGSLNNLDADDDRAVSGSHRTYVQGHAHNNNFSITDGHIYEEIADDETYNTIDESVIN